MQAYWFLYLGGAAAAGFVLREAWRRPRGRAVIDRLFHRIPLFKTLLVGSTMSRFARVLGLTLGSGLPLTDCLVLAGRSSGRPLLRHDTETLLKAVTHGARLIEAFPSCTYITPFAKRMLTAGEESAELTRMCGVICRHYDQETTYLAKALATVLEPILVVAIAGIVLVVALAVFIPMWDMVKLIQ
jgi:MSHA biogenesis protein MshG